MSDSFANSPTNMDDGQRKSFVHADSTEYDNYQPDDSESGIFGSTRVVVTEELLKAVSGEFDMDSVRAVTLARRNVVDVGCLQRCFYLERLDLAHNLLTSVHRLATLHRLHTLDLSDNQLTTLHGLQHAKALACLNIAGNLIASFEELLYLKELPALEEFRVRDAGRHLSNPICQYENYAAIIGDNVLPRLRVLDGAHLRGGEKEIHDLFQRFEKVARQNRVVPDALGAGTRVSGCDAPDGSSSGAQRITAENHQLQALRDEVQRKTRLANQLVADCRSILAECQREIDQCNDMNSFSA